MIDHRLVEQHYFAVLIVFHFGYLALLLQSNRITGLKSTYVLSWFEKARGLVLEVESRAVVGRLVVYLSWYSGLDLNISARMFMVYLSHTRRLFLNVLAASM